MTDGQSVYNKQSVDQKIEDSSVFYKRIKEVGKFSDTESDVHSISMKFDNVDLPNGQDVEIVRISNTFKKVVSICGSIYSGDMQIPFPNQFIYVTYLDGMVRLRQSWTGGIARVKELFLKIDYI